MQPHGPWTIVSTEQVYADPWIQVRRDEVIRPDGAPGSHSVVHLKPGVSVLAIDNDLHVWLTEEFHYGVGRETLEVVSGGVEPDEDPLIAAQRELQEEIGIIARRWDDLGMVDPFTSSVVSPTRLYIARDLDFVANNPEGTEQIRRVRMPLQEAVAAVCDRITHGPSCILLLRAAQQFSSG